MHQLLAVKRPAFDMGNRGYYFANTDFFVMMKHGDLIRHGTDYGT